ncbi:uncharacterized protein VTP21DRAFT_7299 [Calcarisporiella thermophila]|uniref:uncharacterized protein n=1 Tax=Calcarisporiella thermophila TaxID=911321 RepID=UPI00374239D1
MDTVQRWFSKPKPEEMVRKWRQQIRTEERHLNRQLQNIEREEVKVRQTLKTLAKKNDVRSCRMLAKEIIRTRKQKDRLYTSKAQLNSILMQLQHQMALVKVSGTLSKSTEVMHLVNELVKLPQISKAMQDMSMEMTKAGIMEEMIQDTLESLDDEEVEEEAEEEVSKILFEVTDGLLGEAGQVGAPLEIPELPVEEDELELDEMQARLQALKS